MRRCWCLCVNLPAEHGIRYPACRQQLRLVCEHHLPSRKDNQPTGVFNHKYARWTIDQQPLHTAQRQDWTLSRSLTGEHISSVVLIYCHSNGSITFPANSHKIKSTARFAFQLGFLMRRRNCFGWRLHLASETILEDWSVKSLCWSLNSNCQHQFMDPTGEAVVKQNAIHAGKKRKPSWTSERK